MCTCASSFPHGKLSFVISQLLVRPLPIGSETIRWIRRVLVPNLKMMIKKLWFANETPPLQQLTQSYKPTQSPSTNAVRPGLSPSIQKRAAICVGFESKTNHTDIASNIYTPSSSTIIPWQSLIIKHEVRGFSSLAFHLHSLRFVFK